MSQELTCLLVQDFGNVVPIILAALWFRKAAKKMGKKRDEEHS